MDGAHPQQVAAGQGPSFDLRTLAGRLVELSGEGGGATLSLAIPLVVAAQRQQAHVAWVTWASHAQARETQSSSRAPQPTQAQAPFFLPDLLDAGVDPEALPLILAPTPLHAGRAATHLLRSGAFALIVLDLVPFETPDLPLPLLSRLVGLAHRHGTALLALTDKPADAPSLGSLVSLHATTHRRRLAPAEAAHLDPGHAHFEVTLRAIKDKRHGPGWVHTEVFRAPPGL
jgi:recombination protein RecA